MRSRKSACSPRREPRRVAVPVEDVEGGRRVAEQTVVDPVVPDQIVRPHPGKHARQFPPFDHAGELRSRLLRNDRLRGDEDPGRRALRGRHVEHADRDRGAVNLALAARGQMREEGRHGDSARARAPDVDVFAPGDSAHHVHRFLQGADVRVEPEAAFGASGVLPADGESLEASLERELHDALFRHQVEDVELVDLRGRDEQRPLVDPPPRWAGTGSTPSPRCDRRPIPASLRGSCPRRTCWHPPGRACRRCAPGPPRNSRGRGAGSRRRYRRPDCHRWCWSATSRPRGARRRSRRARRRASPSSPRPRSGRARRSRPGNTVRAPGRRHSPSTPRRQSACPGVRAQARSGRSRFARAHRGRPSMPALPRRDCAPFARGAGAPNRECPRRAPRSMDWPRACVARPAREGRRCHGLVLLQPSASRVPVKIASPSSPPTSVPFTRMYCRSLPMLSSMVRTACCVSHDFTCAATNAATSCL